MSPDAPRICIAIDAAVRRARVLAAAESAAVGAAVAAFSPVAGLVVAATVAAWRSRALSRDDAIRALERADPSWRNLLVTAGELTSGTLSAKPAVRDRVIARASARAESIDAAAAFPARRVVTFVAMAAVAWFAAAVVKRPVGLTTPRSGVTRKDPAAGARGGGAFHVTVAVEPPAHTHVAGAIAVDPASLQVVEGTVAVIAVETSADHFNIEQDGAQPAAVRATAQQRVHLTRSGYLLVTAGDTERRLIQVTVTPDALPVVRLSAPARDLIYAGGNPRIDFRAQASDDYGLRSLSLQYTKVSGSGEQFDFKEGELPLTLVRNSTREWQGAVSKTLNELDLHEGDILVYRAVASDERPGDGTASSDTFFIEISKLGVAAGDAFTLPEEDTRYALSQQMLIVKTDRLNLKRSTMAAAAVGEESLNLAVEQRMIRAEIVFMLGGEVQDEEVEAAQSVDIQEGRLANSGQRDLRVATVAMSQAEKLLTGGNTADALKAERAAVTALQRAFARDRYILRAMATRSRLDDARRLTGISTAAGWHRAVGRPPANRRAALLQNLLQGLGEASRAGTRSSVALLAEMSVRIDPQSAALRQSAADLQKVADVWNASSASERDRQLAVVTSRVALEARRSMSDPPAAVGGKP